MAYGKPQTHNTCCANSDSHAKREPAVLSCGSGAGLTLPVSSPSNGCSGGCWKPPALVVGSVAVNTQEMSNPTVKIDFSSIINYGTQSCSGQFFIGIIFQLSKVCDHGSKVPLNTWIFQKGFDLFQQDLMGQRNGLSVVSDFQDPFEFTWCECQDCPGCCSYILEIIDFHTDYITHVSITNVNINALAVE